LYFGIAVPDLLVASHIKPWSKCSDKERLNPRNGLCLSSLHDAAFDIGLITLDEKFRVVLSKQLKSYLPQPALKRNFVTYEGKAIHLPEKLAELRRNSLNITARSCLRVRRPVLDTSQFLFFAIGGSLKIPER